MKILYHHRTLGDGAEGIHIKEMVNIFRQLGHEVMLIGPAVQDQTNAAKKSLKLKWIKKIFKGPAYEIIELAYNVFGFNLVSKAIRLFQPDLIYDRYITFNYSVIAAARKFRVPIFLEVNAPLAYERDKEADETLYLKKIAYWIEKKCCCNASKTIVVSTPLKNYLMSVGVPEKKIMVLPNGVNTEKFYPKIQSKQLSEEFGYNEEDIIIGFVGILRAWHGIEFLLDAFRIICQKEPKCKLLLVGDGPIQSQIEHKIRELGLQNKVTITGRVPHEKVAEYVALFDIAVSPKATFYASPMKIIEYMAQQKAVVAPDMPNIRDLIDNGRTGVLFKPNKKKDLSTTILYLVRNKMKRETIEKGALNAVMTRLNWKENALHLMREHSKTIIF